MIKNLKEVRLATGKTQKEVAAETNIGYKRYNSYETGAREPDAETLILLANYFNVTVDVLMGREENNTFGAKLKSIRTARNLSQRELSETLHVSQQTVGSWEVNRSSPSPEMLKKIALALNTSVLDLLGDVQFSNTLRELRKARNISMKQLGEIIGLSESAISLYETGKREPDYATLTKLADYFNVTVDYLMGRSEEKNNPLTPEESERVNKFDELFSSLSEEQQKNAIDYMKFLLSNRAP